MSNGYITSKMFKLAALFAVAAVAFGAPFDDVAVPLLDGRIVGGQEVKITDYPHQISLLYNNRHRCGGSIIGKKHIVTAAHCTVGLQAASLSIRAGSDTVNAGGSVVKITKVHNHPSYNGQLYDYDIAILELAQELTLGSSVAIVGLPDANKGVPVGTQVTITGWGALKEGGSSPTKLQGVTVPVVSTAVCKESYGATRITDRMLCAGIVDKGGKDSCQGDSGGPLVSGKVLHGVVSWGKGCARPKFPGVYSSVANLRDFIKKTSGI